MFMIKDKTMRLVFIPLLGIVISYVSGIIHYRSYALTGNLLSLVYFTSVSYTIWKGCQWLHLKLRNLYAVDVNPFTKIGSLCLISSLYGSAIACSLTLVWMKISYEQFNWLPILKFIVFSVMAVILFTLVYEVLYLSEERERDYLIVDQLDQELTKAEVAALKNELDPHFIFNSLNTLSYLITNDNSKADLFNYKLAEVYKYFLINKNKDQIFLKKELEFIENYIYLVQIRHENKLHIKIDLNEKEIADSLVIPYALQLLIENAIKHNEFSIRRPLHISITIEGDYLKVENSLNTRNTQKNTTRVGLKNLNAQYLLIFKKNIIIERSEKNFTVQLPIIRPL
jgi:sensor histidine kinase YesM